MSSLIAEVAHQCDDNDCESPGQWHRGSYWVDTDRQYTYDEMSSGDHEEVDPDDVPNVNAIDKSWNAYYTYCAETGTDPLAQLFVKKVVLHREWWLITFRQRDGNIVVTDGTLLAAVVGETVVTDPLVMRDAPALPDHVRAFCGLTNDHPNIVYGYEDEWPDLSVMLVALDKRTQQTINRNTSIEVVFGSPGIARLRIVVDHSEPCDPEDITVWTREHARASLSRAALDALAPNLR